jgi:Flp pilus assembly protein CpaB
LAVAPAAARPRPGGGRFLIIIGLLLAVLAGGGVFLLGNFGGGGGAIGGSSQIVAVVAAQTIPIRHQITDADLTTTKISGNIPNTYGKTSDVKDLISEIQISKGALITSDMLARDAGLITLGTAPAYLPLASGYVAITIPTGEQQGVAGHITLGDYMTVIASGGLTLFSPKTGASISGAVSKTVFTNVRIIGLGPASSNVQPATGAAAAPGSSAVTSGITSSLTIELTQCDAEYFTWFLTNMTLKYAVESFTDYLKQPPSAPDPTCPTVLAAQGVTNKQVDARYHFSALLA